MSWSFVAPQRTPVHGGSDYPSVRYSAAAVAYRGELIVTHGYFYNRAPPSLSHTTLCATRPHRSR